MKLYKVLFGTAILAVVSTSNAAPINGFTDAVDNGGGSYTFTFDSLTGGDIFGNTEGLLFSAFGIDLTVTGSATVIQDVPSNGGLGVNGGANGDNMGLGEWLNFSFNQSVDLSMISFNGGIDPNNGHSDIASDGLVDILGNGAGGGGFGNLHMIASSFDGVSPDSYVTDLTSFAGYGLSDMTNLLVASSNYSPTNNTPWNGYVESITVKLSNNVPEPSAIALFGLGLAGLGFSKRKKS